MTYSVAREQMKLSKETSNVLKVCSDPSSVEIPAPSVTHPPPASQGSDGGAYRAQSTAFPQEICADS